MAITRRVMSVLATAALLLTLLIPHTAARAEACTTDLGHDDAVSAEWGSAEVHENGKRLDTDVAEGWSIEVCVEYEDGSGDRAKIIGWGYTVTADPDTDDDGDATGDVPNHVGSKVWVCKFTGEPDGEASHVIAVNRDALDDDGEFVDAHGSFVIDSEDDTACPVNQPGDQHDGDGENGDDNGQGNEGEEPGGEDEEPAGEDDEPASGDDSDDSDDNGQDEGNGEDDDPVVEEEPEGPEPSTSSEPVGELDLALGTGCATDTQVIDFLAGGSGWESATLTFAFGEEEETVSREIGPGATDKVTWPQVAGQPAERVVVGIEHDGEIEVDGERHEDGYAATETFTADEDCGPTEVEGIAADADDRDQGSDDGEPRDGDGDGDAGHDGDDEPQVRGEQLERAATHPETGVSALLLALIGALSLSLGAGLLHTTRRPAHNPGVGRTQR